MGSLHRAFAEKALVDNEGVSLPLCLLVVFVSIVAESSSGNELKDFESNVEVRARKVREGDKPMKKNGKKKGPKPIKKRKNRNKSNLSKRKDGKGTKRTSKANERKKKRTSKAKERKEKRTSKAKEVK